MFGTAIDVLQIIFADIILSADNALVVGMAAAGLSPELRRKAILLGMALAAGLRIAFAAMATSLLAVPGILFFGGLLLAWVCWRFYCEIREGIPQEAGLALEGSGHYAPPERTMWSALVTIAVADVSMSLDNVIAVAAIARGGTELLVFGLVLAVVLMALFATMIMHLMANLPWLGWVGLLFLIYLAGEMIYVGLPEAFAVFAGPRGGG